MRMDLTLLLIVLISCLILYLSLKTLFICGNLPPGPRPLPILGNVLEVGGGDIVNSLLKLREKYGDVFTIYLGSRRVVVVNGYKLVREVYLDKGDDYLNRGSMPSWDANYKDYGIIHTGNLECWKDLRRFSVPTLRNFGFAKRSTEDIIQEEAQCLVAELKKTEESFMDPHQYLSRAFCNIVFSIFFGSRQEYGDKDLDTMLSYMFQTFVTVSSAWGQLYEMFPGLMRFIPGPHQKIRHLLKIFSQFIDSRVQINLKTLDPNNPRNYIDAFFIKIVKEKTNPRSHFNMRNLLSSIEQIIFAAVETTSTTLSYSLLVLLKYPDVLAKVHEEIDHVIGRNRIPAMQDRYNLPYTEATIYEMQRFTDLLPMGVPRKTTTEVTLNGYTIPKDTNIFPMLTTVLKDPMCFKYPKEFNPENFLNEKGEFQKNNAFMPLAAGKRMCLGEPIVRMELFIFLVTILQNFNLKCSVPVEELDITPNVSGLGNFPKPYTISFIPR